MAARTLIRFGISAFVFLIFLVHTAGWLPFRLLNTVEHFAYDERVRLTLPGTNDPRVVVLDMDERSLAIEGWPWPRNKLAALVTQLFDTYHIAALGFDIVWADPDVREVNVVDELAAKGLADLPGFAERVPALRAALDYDRQFADAMRGKPVILGFAFKNVRDRAETVATGALCQPVMDASAAKLYAVDFVEVKAVAGNVPVLQQAAAGCGFFDNPLQDEDGVFRRVPLLEQYGGAIYQSLPLALVRTYLGNPPIELEFEPPDVRNSLHLERANLGPRIAPVDGQVAVYVPFRGAEYTYAYVPATDVLHGKFARPELLKGAIVIFGTSAAGLVDLRVTPVSKVHPGVEVHASIISGLLDSTIRQKAPYYMGIEAVLLLLIALLAAFAYTRLPAAASAGMMVGVIVVVTGLAFWLWVSANFIMPLGVPVTFTLAVFMAHLLYGYFIESRGKREISKLFGQYVPPELVEEMAEHPEDISMEGESREMTVLFSDVRNFTSISEKLDAKDLASMLNSFLSKQTAVVQKHRGTIDKYIGDLIMAFWGAPLPDKDHVLNGVLAGMQMQRAIRELDPEFEKRGWPKLHIGVGINSGKMSVGNMGSAFRMAYTVMGDSVNLASRLEGLTKEYGVGVLISENTRTQLPVDWAFREVDLVIVKGRTEPVAIYEPMGPKEQLEPALRQDLARHRGAMKLYRAQKWDEAEAEFFNLNQSGRPHPIYEVFIQRIMQWREEPPRAGWNGAWTAKSK